MKLDGSNIPGLLGRLRTGPRPRLLVVEGNLVIVAAPDRCIVLPDFFRTGGDLVWNPTSSRLVWTLPHGEIRSTVPLSAGPDLSALRTQPEKKGTGKAWALGVLLLLILPVLWVRLFLPTVPGGLAAPSRYGVPYSAPPPGPPQRISGTGWMK